MNGVQGRGGDVTESRQADEVCLDDGKQGTTVKDDVEHVAVENVRARAQGSIRQVGS